MASCLVSRVGWLSPTTAKNKNLPNCRHPVGDGECAFSFQIQSCWVKYLTPSGDVNSGLATFPATEKTWRVLIM